jgi:uncharacterized phage protein (TIGR01671 family)
MKELRFRAWDIDNKEFVYISGTTDGEIWIDNGISTVIMPEHKGPYEQYTGLKDKKGKKIYEGDICRLIYSEIRDGRKRWKKVNEDIERVEFEDGYFKFSNTDQYGIGSELSFSDYGEWSTADGSYKYEAEVIGNIHENPELLGGKE